MDERRNSEEKEPRTTTAIRFPGGLHERLRAAAEERGVSINFMVVKAAEEFLDRLIPADEVRWTRDSSTAA